MVDEKELAGAFARNLRARRKYLGLSQAELAEQSGVDRGTIGKWERADKKGSIPYGLTSAAKVCSALGIRLDETLGL